MNIANKKPTVINLLGGPGSGKSTSAMDISSYLKKTGHIVEYAHEAAKDMTYAKNFIGLSDQLYVLGKQNHKLWRLAKNNIEVIVTDSPLLLSLTYLNNDSKYNIKVFHDIVLECWNQYNNICIFMERDDLKYQTFGRNQAVEQAKEIDDGIKEVLAYLKIPYHTIRQDENSVENLIKIIESELV
jgi:ABC-type oligopeptide transport system ATPase subunit